MPVTKTTNHVINPTSTSDLPHSAGIRGQTGIARGAMMVPIAAVGTGRKPSGGLAKGLDHYVISIRRMTLGSGYRYLMESIATGDGAPLGTSSLTSYYAESGTPPGVFLGAGLAGLDEGRGVEKGSTVSEEHLFNLLGMCADPVTGKALGRKPNRSHLSLATRMAERVRAIEPTSNDVQRAELMVQIEAEERAVGGKFRTPVAGFDLTFAPLKSVSTAWALADSDTKAQIFACHRRAIEIVLAYAEREVFHSRSGTNGVVQEDIEGVVATAFTHWDSRAGDPQLHDHVVVANRARSVSDGTWRTLDSRGLFKSVVALSELHQGVLSDLLTESLGWGWDGRTRRYSDQPRWEVTGVSDVLMAEFSQRGAVIEERKNTLVAEYASAHGRQPTNVEVVKMRQRANLETRPAKEHHGLAQLTDSWRQRSEKYVGSDQESWVAGLADRNDLPLLHARDLDDGILSDAASVAVRTVAERRATFSRANILAEVHRQFHGVRFASPDERIAVVERTANLATAQSLLISAPELHHTPERLRRADGTSRFRAKGHEIYTTAILLEAESHLLSAGQCTDGPVTSQSTVAAVTAANLPGRDHSLGLDQAVAVEQIATSGRSLDLLVGPAGTGKSTTMAGLREAWESEHGPGSVLGLAPSAAAAEVLAAELGIDTENTAKWLYEHRQEPDRLTKIRDLRMMFGSSEWSERSLSGQRRIAVAEEEVARWRLRRNQLVIVEEASLAGTFALDELVTAAEAAEAKVLLVGDQAQLTAVEAGGMFAALVRDRGDLVTELSDVRRFHHDWEKEASVELRAGSPDAIDAYQAHERIASGSREEMLDALYRAWEGDIEAGQRSLMIAGDLGTVNELNARARVDRVAAGKVNEVGLSVAGGATAGIGDRVVTRQNNRRLSTGRRWVRNGDQWTVTAIEHGGTMTLQRANGTGQVVLSSDYVREHVELAYASTAHRAQGRTVDTAHAMVSPTTTREVLYVSGTRGREANNLYVDTHYDPDPQTSHGEVGEPVTAKEVLAGVLRNEGADVAAHDMIRRQQHEAEGMERLSAEYLTLATLAQEERWDALLVRSGFTDAELASVRTSEALGPMFAAFREAESRGLDVEAAVPKLIAGRSLADSADVAAVLHGRLDRWAKAAAGRSRDSTNLIVGLIPRAQGVTDPEMASVLAERVQAMEMRARTLAEQAIEAGSGWVQGLGTTPTDSDRRARWLHEVSIIAAYRDRWHITGQRLVGGQSDVGSTEQMDQRQLALSAAERARRVCSFTNQQQASATLEPQIEASKGVEL
jgi:conjugative relaxase-like TrwC/TraI family protein